ncbi:MAG: radical SAM protein [Candidatus Thermoplasmatota archaeon]|nr:radical SAM protein [Candidatus Thermoplasmatota archaeon]
MTKRYHWLHQSHYFSPISTACNMCAKGAKMVVLITGLCPAHCFYCPLSKKKQNKDVIYADEWQLKNEQDLITLKNEAELIKATGAGITGGDPLLVPQRTIQYIKFLKQRFGKKFHIHLYTSGLKNSESIKKMVNAGLDEIRFHPEPKYWNQMEISPLENVITHTIKLPVKVALEIPVLPDNKQDIIDLINWAEEKKIDYINLNELEFSEQNEDELYKRGFTVKDELSAAAKGSQKTAYNILSYFENQSLHIGIHYCSSSFKDGVQLTNRMKRRAKSIATSHDIVTEEGTILKGIIDLDKSQKFSKIMSTLEKRLHLTKNQYQINKEKNRIELHPQLLEENKKTLFSQHLNCFIIEEYPTADHLEVERIPLS